MHALGWNSFVRLTFSEGRGKMHPGRVRAVIASEFGLSRNDAVGRGLATTACWIGRPAQSPVYPSFGTKGWWNEVVAGPVPTACEPCALPFRLHGSG